MATRKARVSRVAAAELRILAKSAPFVILMIWAIHHFGAAHGHRDQGDSHEVASRSIG